MCPQVGVPKGWNTSEERKGVQRKVQENLNDFLKEPKVYGSKD